MNFMMQKLVVEFEDGADISGVMKNVRQRCKKVDSDFEIYI